MANKFLNTPSRQPIARGHASLAVSHASPDNRTKSSNLINALESIKQSTKPLIREGAKVYNESVIKDAQGSIDAEKEIKNTLRGSKEAEWKAKYKDDEASISKAREDFNREFNESLKGLSPEGREAALKARDEDDARYNQLQSKIARGKGFGYSNLAYNSLKAQDVVLSLGSYTRDHIIERHGDEFAGASDQQLEAWTQEAMADFKKDHEGSTYYNNLSDYVLEDTPKVSAKMAQVRDAEQRVMVQKLVSNQTQKIFDDFMADKEITDRSAQAFHDYLDRNLQVFRQGLAQDGLAPMRESQVQELVASSLFTKAMGGSKEAAQYINSDVAKERFNLLPDYDKNLKVANRSIAINAKNELAAAHKNDREMLYTKSLVDPWESKNQMKRDVMASSLPAKEKRTLIKQFTKDMDEDATINNIVGAYAKGNPTPLLAAKDKDQEEAFYNILGQEFKGMNVDSLALPGNESALDKVHSYVESGAPLPKVFKDQLNQPISNGDLGVLTARSELLEKVSTLSPRLRDTMFEPETQAKMSALNMFLRDVTLQDKDGNVDPIKLKAQMDAYDASIIRLPNGRVSERSFQNELTQTKSRYDESLREKIRKQSEDVSWTIDPNESVEYQTDTISDMYVLKRKVGVPADKALEEAKEFYDNTHTAIELEGGQEVSIPNEWDTGNFPKSFKDYVESTGLDEKISRNYGTPVDHEDLVIVPASDYAFSRKMVIKYRNSIQADVSLDSFRKATREVSRQERSSAQATREERLEYKEQRRRQREREKKAQDAYLKSLGESDFN